MDVDASVSRLAQQLAPLNRANAISLRRASSFVYILFEGRVVAEVAPASLRILPTGRRRPIDLQTASGRQRLVDVLAVRVGALSLPELARPHEESQRSRQPPSPPAGPSAVSELELLAGALRERGLTVTIVNGAVEARGFGRVELDRHGPARTAQSFMAKHSVPHLPAIEQRLASYFRDPRAVPVVVRRTPRTVQVRVGPDVVGIVTRFAVTGMSKRPNVYGDFVKDPAPLAVTRLAVADALASSRAAPTSTQTKVASTAATPARLSTKADAVEKEFPPGMSEAQRTRAMVASARLRTSRRLAPAVDVITPAPRGSLRFERLVEGENPLEARFEWKLKGAAFRGALRLKGVADPLPLRVQNGSDRQLIGEAWALALIVYAELTCLEERAAPPSRAPLSRRQQRTSGGSSLSVRSHRASLGSHRGAANGARLIFPTLADAAEELRSISGFLRRLPPTWSSSSEAESAAASVGIRIPPGYTWVRPHQRSNRTIEVRLPGLKLW